MSLPILLLQTLVLLTLNIPHNEEENSSISSQNNGIGATSLTLASDIPLDPQHLQQSQSHDELSDAISSPVSAPGFILFTRALYNFLKLITSYLGARFRDILYYIIYIIIIGIAHIF